MTDRELLQKALDALEEAQSYTSSEIWSPSMTNECAAAAEALRAALAQPEQKLWLWKNFVDGRPEYWAFDNPYPTNLDNGDPQTLGQPCGYAIFKPSRNGSCGRTEEQVLREMKSVIAPPQREVYCGCGDEIVSGDGARCGTCVAVKYKEKDWQGLTDEEIENCFEMSMFGTCRAIEAKLREKNG